MVLAIALAVLCLRFTANGRDHQRDQPPETKLPSIRVKERSDLLIGRTLRPNLETMIPQLFP
jgi:hypothetical protein